MNQVEAPHAASEKGGFELLLGALQALERAYIEWDLDGIASHGASVRLALERAARGGESPDPETLREVMAINQRCQRLADAGGEIAGTVARLGALTYRAGAPVNVPTLPLQPTRPSSPRPSTEI